MDVDSAAARGGTGSARRRRERRLRHHWRPGCVPAPRRPTGTDHGQDRAWVRGEAHGQVPEEAPTLQEPGTRYFSLGDNDSVPELGGSRPDRLPAVSGPQERVVRRIVERIDDSASVVPLLRAPVAQTVDSVVEVLHFFLQRWPAGAEQVLDCEAERVIDVPKIILHSAPQRSSLPEPQMAEQLVAVPVIQFIIFRRHEGELGIAVCRDTRTTWMMCVYDTGWSDTASPGRCTNIGHR